MSNVCLENITRRFGNVNAIDDISFTIPDGEFWVLVGPSGCGKSTIMRMIAGLETATSGNIYIDDFLVNDVPARARDVAMVFQNYALYPHMTVAENLAFGLQMRKIDSEIIKNQVDWVAKSLNIFHLLNRKPKQLSGGQQQRVALGRAIVRKPKVFLLDEPLSNLDAQLRDDTRAELKELHQKVGITTIYVTHDQVEAMTLADKIVVLNGGKIQQVGEPQVIYNRPANRMVAEFIGNPSVNVFPAVFDGVDFEVGNQKLKCSTTIKKQIKPISAQGFDLGIRPEFIYIIAPENKENFAELKVLVKVVEPLGRETVVRASLPGVEGFLSLLLPASVRPSLGESISVFLDLNQLFIFDASTGERLFPV
jgi:multiple sugar transport system ATP-binding protein